MSVPMTLRDLERLDTWVKFIRRISLIMPVAFDLQRPNLAGKHMWEGVFLGPYSKRSPILGFPSRPIYARTL